MNDLLKICLENGAYKAEKVKTDKLNFSSTFRTLCERNSCGRYGKNYMCPPHVGEIDALIEKICSYQDALIWQTVHKLEDSYDFEGMMEGQSAQ